MKKFHLLVLLFICCAFIQYSHTSSAARSASQEGEQKTIIKGGWKQTKEGTWIKQLSTIEKILERAKKLSNTVYNAINDKLSPYINFLKKQLGTKK